ncbi:MAG: prephenate dehydrogenase/arogenate dehydrogenase family protein [Armatimonadota bacterium]|nr:MAG: prephenate dehydrogenase/arogenate dehydrogenase family protein [Armatimonadota bacterium]
MNEAPTGNKRPAFDCAAIIGAGLIGGSIGMALRERGIASHVVAVARSEETLRLAVSRGAADRATLSLSEAAAEADLVILATPVSLIIEHVAAIAEMIADECLVTDVGSVKGPIVAAAEESLPCAGRFVGGHPLAGSERKGIAAARSDLLDGATWVLTPTRVTDEDALNRIEDLVARLGARSLLLSPQEHDVLVGRTSHLPHVVAAALMRVVAEAAKEYAEILDVIGPGLRDTTRIAASDPALWADIALANAAVVLAGMGEMNEALSRFKEALEAGNREELERLFAGAQRAREGL